MTKNRKGARLRISEIYESLQGEGMLTGTPSVFVRTSGCNLRCWFCDTRFASWEPEGDHRTIEEITASVDRHSANHIVLTGGEPMIYDCLPELAKTLRDDGQRHLTIETAGTIYHPVECDLMSISPKLSSSTPGSEAGSWKQAHESRRERLDVVRRMLAEYECQLKFVVDNEHDAQELLGYLDRLGSYPVDRVLLMPQGTNLEDLEATADWLRPWCLKHGFRYCPRAHIEWYGNRRGT